jgi:hypothetical protein
VRPCTDPAGPVDRYYRRLSPRDAERHRSGWSENRFAMDPEGRPGRRTRRRHGDIGGAAVKANLTRFTVAMSLLATMALSLGAGLKW